MGLRRFVSLALVITVVAFLKKAQSCSCLPQHPQGQFCNAQFVIRGKIVERKTTSEDDTSSSYNYLNYFNGFTSEVVYDIDVDRVYKGQFKHSTTVSIYTSASSASCGVPGLQEGETYVMAGYGEDKPSINLCGFVTKYSDLTRKQRKGFNFFYWRGCLSGCEIQFFGDPSPTTCLYNGQNQDCQYRHAHCRLDPRRNWNCNWKGGRRYLNCIESNIP